MGLLDLAAPALSWADMKLAVLLPSVACLIVWGAVAATASMGLYRLVSPQQRIARIATEERRLRFALQDQNIEIADGLASAGGLLRLAMARIGLVLLPAMFAALPVLVLMAWLPSRYGSEMPSTDQTVAVTVTPSPFRGQWIASTAGTPHVIVTDAQGTVAHALPVSAPVPVIHKRVWWNTLIGNPLGYLPDSSPVERIEIGLAEKRYLALGPDWLRGWETLFLATLLAGSVFLKLRFRIQ